MTNIEPLHDRVVVERLPDEDQEHSGLIYIPEVARKQSMKARVLAVGPGRWIDGVFTKTAVKPGDVVILPGYGGQHPDWEDNQQMIIQEGDIGCILG